MARNMNGYRFHLRRDVPLPLGEDDAGTLLWIMLNPSTADDTLDDHTIRCIRRFTADTGYGRLVVGNLFAQRATQPTYLVTPTDELFHLNRCVIFDAMDRADRTVVAWGNSCPRQVRYSAACMVAAILERAHEIGRPLWCLGVTDDGAPRHPSRMPARQPLVEWRPPT